MTNQRPVTDWRPTTDLTLRKISNCRNSAADRLIHSMFGFSVWFSMSSNWTALFLFEPNSKQWSAAVLNISDGHISAVGRPIHFVFRSRLGIFSRSADRMALLTGRSNSRWRLVTILEISDSHISAKGHPIHFIFGSSALFRGSPHNSHRMSTFVWMKSKMAVGSRFEALKWHISGTHYPVHFMYGHFTLPSDTIQYTLSHMTGCWRLILQARVAMVFFG